MLGDQDVLLYSGTESKHTWIRFENVDVYLCLVYLYSTFNCNSSVG